MDLAKNLKRAGSLRSSSISPPPKRRRGLQSMEVIKDDVNFDLARTEESSTTNSGRAGVRMTTDIPSPVQLNSIPQLPASSNIDTVSLGNILGDPMIKECWLFNYLFDVDFVMSQFDYDVRDLVNVCIVHGSWRKEDSNRISIEEGAKRFPNVKVIKAYMPEAYGTHHSKMIVLFRHDDLAQVIILTGNFIEQDWQMSQAFWQSPLLPLQQQGPQRLSVLPPLGSGHRFKHDLLAYLYSYGTKLSLLTAELSKFDFSKVRGALVASSPGKQHLQGIDSETESLWGLPGLKRVLSNIPTKLFSKLGSRSDPFPQPHVVVQVSSVASVGEKWLSTTFLPTVSASKPPTTQNPTSPTKSSPPPKFSLVFPSAPEIRNSISGYISGSSIHMKTSSPAQAKQLSYLRPMLCHWATPPFLIDEFKRSPVLDASRVHTLAQQATNCSNPTRQAGRARAAPHIKTYIRFSSPHMTAIDWAMVTSANLSTQAWGSAPSFGGEVRVCSYEIGVVVWPALWEDVGGAGGTVEMVPVFGGNAPPTLAKKGEAGDGDGLEDKDKDGDGNEDVKGEVERAKKVRVGWRMPYDLPLAPYAEDEMPWCATKADSEPDWLGRVWPGYGA